jgi:hypothetical protein
MGKYANISVPLKVKKRLQEVKGNRTWANFFWRNSVNANSSEVKKHLRNSGAFFPKRFWRLYENRIKNLGKILFSGKKKILTIICYRSSCIRLCGMQGQSVQPHIVASRSRSRLRQR